MQLSMIQRHLDRIAEAEVQQKIQRELEEVGHVTAADFC